MLTINGKSELVVQGASAYQRVLNPLEKGHKLGTRGPYVARSSEMTSLIVCHPYGTDIDPLFGGINKLATRRGVGILGYKVKAKCTLQAGWRYLDVNYRSKAIFDAAYCWAISIKLT